MRRELDSCKVERFRRVVTKGLGLAMDDAKLELLAEVLGMRLTTWGGGAEAYLGRLETQTWGEEIAALAQELTVPETYFFRNIDQFRALRELVLPQLAARRSQGPVRILSAGCASGEEPYSIAMVVQEAMAEPDQAVIRAVDINPAILRKAARGRFGNWAFRETSAEMQQRWFQKEGAEFAIADRVLRAVRFEPRNLVVDDPELWRPQSQDVVFCRNVIMYFPSETARTVVARIAETLVPGGYLFLGHAETLRGLSQDFHLRHSHGTFYYQRKLPEDRSLGREATFDRRPVQPHVLPVHPQDDAWVAAIDRSTARIKRLAQSTPPARRRASVQAREHFAPAFDLLSRERFAEALDLLETYPPAHLDDPDAILLRAALLAHAGRLDLAETTCRRLLQVDEMSAGAHFILALCREGVGDHQGAIEQNRIAAYLDPTFAMPRLNLGLRARRDGDLATARRDLTEALRLLEHEEPARLLLFGGGFRREALRALCWAELQACERAA